MSALRSGALFRYLRRSPLAQTVLRPIWDRRQIRHWWAQGRPNPPPHAVKLAAILYLADQVGARNLVETGAYLGDTVRALRGRFARIHTIELAEALARPLQREFAADPRVEVILGDSSTALIALLPRLEGPTVFWLDAHYSGGQTAGAGFVPILHEVEGIAAGCPGAHAILIDDLKDFIGQDGYPTATDLETLLRARGYQTFAASNMLHAVRM